MKDFDETIKRDPADRAAVDKLRRYAEERSGTIAEIEWNGQYFLASDIASFVFGWEREYGTFFACFGGYSLPTQVEVMPPETLKELRHLQTVWTVGCMEIPEFIQGLPELRVISINSIHTTSELPEWIGDFSKLERLSLTGHFSSIPYSVVRTGLPFTDDKKVERGVVLSNVILKESDVLMYLSNDRELIEAYYHGEQAGEDYGLSLFGVGTPSALLALTYRMW